MKLASLKGGRDGASGRGVARPQARASPVPDIAPTLQQALDDWARARAAPGAMSTTL